MMTDIDQKENIGVTEESDGESDEYSSDDSTSSHMKSRLRMRKTINKYIENEDKDEADYIKCPRCPRLIMTKIGIHNHMRIHYVDRKFICALCEAVFDLNSELIEHKLVHKDEERIFLCHSCQEAFSNHCDYLIHKVSHLNRLNYKCLECGVYKKRSDIRCHIKSHFKNVYQCKVCKKNLQTEYGLNCHSKTHENNIVCVECGQLLKSNYEYQSHMDNHIGLKRHQCLYCGQAFAFPNAVTVHTRKHINDKPYQCGICGNRFDQQSNLKNHIERHDRTSKYVECIVCNRKFRFSKSLQNHMKRHTKKGLLYCPECNKPCQNKISLRVHMLYNHTDKKIRMLYLQ